MRYSYRIRTRKYQEEELFNDQQSYFSCHQTSKLTSLEHKNAMMLHPINKDDFVLTPLINWFQYRNRVPNLGERGSSYNHWEFRSVYFIYSPLNIINHRTPLAFTIHFIVLSSLSFTHFFLIN